MSEVWRCAPHDVALCADCCADAVIPCDQFEDVINCNSASGCVFDYFSDECYNASKCTVACVRRWSDDVQASLAA